MENMAVLISVLTLVVVSSVDSTPILVNINLASGSTKLIQSLNYPSNYTNYLDYTWKVSAPDDHSVEVIFRDFALEEGYDFLSVEYNHSESSGQGILLANLTGSTYPTHLTSPVNNLWVRFTSDYSITAPGFSIKVKAVPLTDAVTTESIATSLETVSQSTTSPSLSTSHHTDPTVLYLSEDQTLLTTMETASTGGVSGDQEMVEHSTGSAQERTASSASDMLFSTDTIGLTTMETAPTSMQLMDDELVTTDTIPATSPVVSKISAHLTSTDTTFEMIGTVTPEDSSQYSTQSNLQTTITPSSGSTIPMTSSDTTSLPLQTLTMMTESDSNRQSESTLETSTESTVSLNPSDTKQTTEETNVVSTEVKDEFTFGTIKSTHMYMQTSGIPTQASYEDTTLPYDSFTSRLYSDIFHLTNNPSDAPDAQTSQEWEEPTTFIAQSLPEVSEDPETPPLSTSAIGASIQSQTHDASTTQGMMKSVSITATSSDSNTALISASEATIRSTSSSTIEPNVETTESESTQLPGTTNPADVDINLESGDSKTVQSPNYPSNYDNNLDYSWYITAPPDHTINIEFQDFYLETGYDFLRFKYDSSDGYSSRTSIADITGTSYPSALVSPVNNLWIQFTTDSSITKMGFSIVVNAVATTAAPTSTTAGSLQPSFSTTVAETYVHLTSGNSQTIQSRNYPSNYDNDIDSIWYITAPLNYTIRVDFGDFNLETNYDFLVFEYEPFPGSSSYITLANLTGTSYPSYLESPSNNLRINFITDYSITKTGFSIGVTAVSAAGMILSTGATSTSKTASLTSIVNTSPVEDTSYIFTSTDGALSSEVMTMSTPEHSTTSSNAMVSLNSGSSADMDRTTSPEYLSDFHLTEPRSDVTTSDDLAVATTSTSFTANMANEITSGTTQQIDVVLSEESTQTPEQFGSSPSHSFMSVISEFLTTTEPTTTSSQAIDVQTTPLVSQMTTPNTAITSLPSQSHSPAMPMSTFTEQTSDTPQTTEEILTSLTPTTSDSIYSFSSIIITTPINFQTSVLQTDEALIESTSNIITKRSETVAPVSQEYASTELSSISSQTRPNVGTTTGSEDGIGSTSNIITERSETVAPVSQEYISTELSSISSQTAPNAGTTTGSEDGIGSTSNIITERSETLNPVSEEYVSTELSSISSQTTPNAGTTTGSEHGIGSVSNIIIGRSETVNPASQEFVTTVTSSMLSRSTSAGNPEVSMESISKITYTNSELPLSLLVNSEFATGSTPLTSKTTDIPNPGEVTSLSSRVPTRRPTLNTDSALYDDTPFTSTPLNSMRTSMFTLQYTNRSMMKEYSLSTYQNATTVKCGKECLTHPMCDSFAINKQMNKCILGLHTAVVGHIYEEINSFIYVATIKYS
ncbi:mucin-17-like [Lytechinus variegatus]|uniref:mucin-17-like n=1 Tax=Lytechinus variegatus TaxID=7654 RepID=UPI001BB18D0F|nr:mucin-17-like [Lytechinus variegatus]